jgi:hypothetical protein
VPNNESHLFRGAAGCGNNQITLSFAVIVVCDYYHLPLGKCPYGIGD